MLTLIQQHKEREKGCVLEMEERDCGIAFTWRGLAGFGELKINNKMFDYFTTVSKSPTVLKC